MNADKLILIRPDPKEHREAIFDLTGKTFGQRGYWHWRRYCRSYFDRSHYDWSASTIGLWGGRVVTHWGVWGYRMRIGRARVRAAGIGAVATDGELRNRGLMARTAAAAIEAMRRAGYDLSVLFGISNFYNRFGYVRAWPRQGYVVYPDQLPTDPPAGSVRKYALRHRDDLARVFNAASRRLTGTAVRPTYLRRGRSWAGHLWLDAAGRPAGYVVTDLHHGTLELIDSAGDCEQILRVLRRLARRGGAARIRFCDLHHDSELATRLRRGNCRFEADYQRSGGAMVRTLGLASTLKRMAAELSARLRRSGLADWRGRLLIADRREKVTLVIDRSGVRLSASGSGRAGRHAVRGGDEIAQLLIGTDEPAETVRAGRMRLAGDARRLVEVLFPNQHPVLSLWDSF